MFDRREPDSFDFPEMGVIYLAAYLALTDSEIFDTLQVVEQTNQTWLNNLSQKIYQRIDEQKFDQAVQILFQDDITEWENEGGA